MRRGLIRGAALFTLTVVEPMMMESGGPVQMSMSPTQAAGSPPMMTVGQPGGMMATPTCGTGTGAGVCIGQMCISLTRAAGGMVVPLILTSGASLILLRETMFV
jgi:hypothetical protein